MTKNETSSIVLPGWAILVELIFRSAVAARPLFSSIRPAELGEYWKIKAQLPEQYQILTLSILPKQGGQYWMYHF